MAMTRIKYGVEYDARDMERKSSGHGYGWIVVLVLLIAAVSFIVHIVNRMSSARPVEAAPAEESADPHAPVIVRSAGSDEIIDVDNLGSRSPKVRNLMLRLKEAREKNEIAKQVTAIEALRILPADDIADFEDELIALLGDLNLQWLFELKNRQWVTEITVKKGDSARRIAAESGSTLGSLKRLNPSVAANENVLRPGMKLLVMNHPEFSLIIHKRLRAVDLQLGGKLFKRYLLPEDAPAIRLEPGNGYTTPANLRDFFRRQGIGLSAEDAAEIDLLVPGNSSLIVSPS